MIVTKRLLIEDASKNRNNIRAQWSTFQKKKEESHYYSCDLWIFISHKHGDNEILIDVISILNQHGGKAYFDWMDETMPESTNGATAEKVKTEILCTESP